MSSLKVKLSIITFLVKVNVECCRDGTGGVLDLTGASDMPVL